MAGRIFVNYRRDDVPGDARGVRDGLAAKFGKSSVFMDVDNLLVGQRFDVELAKALDACDVLIAVIGPRWMDLLTTRTASGERDYVREEIAAALKRNIVVIPVRVGREGSMPALPRADDLPRGHPRSRPLPEARCRARALRSRHGGADRWHRRRSQGVGCR